MTKRCVLGVGCVSHALGFTQLRTFLIWPYADLLSGKVDFVGVAPHHFCSGEDVVAQLALDPHGLIFVDQCDVQAEGVIGGEDLPAVGALCIGWGRQALFAEMR